MTALTDRIEDIGQSLQDATGKAREDLLDHLEQAVLGLDAVGEHVPAWAREAIEARHDSQAEDGFDNMPL